MADPLRILIHNDETAAFEAKLRAAHPDAAIASCNSYAALPQTMAQFRPDVVYTVRFDGTPGYPRDALFGPCGPRWVANGGAGTDHFGMWDTAQTTVTNAAGVAAGMMAEYVMGSFLHFTLNVPGLQADQRARTWQPRVVRPLKGKTLLIVGLGHTGRAVAARAGAFGMNVLGTRATPRPMDHVDEVHGSDRLTDLLPRAAFIAICTPLIPATRHLIDRASFERMKPGVILADVSRGGVVDQDALLRAMDKGRVAGAALDVFETEPLPAASPLWSQPGVLISPHCSSVYDGWAEASFDLFLANLANWVAGDDLFNVVDPYRGY